MLSEAVLSGAMTVWTQRDITILYIKVVQREHDPCYTPSKVHKTLVADGGSGKR